MDKNDSGKVEIVDSDVRLTMPRTGKKAKALGLAIRKWQLILRYTQTHRHPPFNIGEPSCALCQVYLVVDGNCLRCPVCIHTGVEGCRFTPFTRFVAAPNIDQYRLAAKQEVEFLKSLKED